VRHLLSAFLGVLALAPRVASACPPAEPHGTTRYLTHGYAVGATHGVGGALGEGVASDSLRYSETNGAVMDLLFGAPMRLVDSRIPKPIDCAAGACTYLDATLWTPSFQRLAGGLFSAGVSFPFERERPEGPTIVQLGVAIGFFDDGAAKHARDALVVSAAVPMTRRLHARMRMELNLYGAFESKELAKYRRNSPMSAGVTADLGSWLQLTADVERYDVVRGGVGWSLGAAARF